MIGNGSMNLLTYDIMIGNGSMNLLTYDIMIGNGSMNLLTYDMNDRQWFNESFWVSL
jgi:hypothetical protein